MKAAGSESELAERASRFLKAEMKRANVTYEELAERMKGHGFAETRASISAKLQRGTFAATFLIGVLAALGLESLHLEDL